LLTEEAFHEHLPSVFKAMDQPSSDGINTWFISKYARENGLKAVLSGVGSDELYGGYPSFERIHKLLYLQKLPNHLLRSGKFTGLKKLRRLGYLSLEGTHGKYLFLRGQFIPFEIAEHLRMDESEVWRVLQEHPHYEMPDRLSPKNEVSWMELNIYMQNQLLKDADVMSMAHGVEIRVPYLDKEFVNLSLAIKSELKYAGARPKQLLIDSFKHILPESIWNRPKMGFSFPFRDWLSKNEFSKDMIGADDSNYQKFISGNLHWSQFLSLVLIKNNHIV
jgi:asparagine synthase (glutamine-hydrolysing)